MRVLVATTAGAGHLGPMVPFARALVEAGHDVVVTAPSSFGPAVTRAGFVHQPFADADPVALGAVFATLPGRPNEEANAIVVREVFGRLDTQAALPGVRALVEQWGPNLILRETSELASYVVAESAGIPHAQVAVGLAAFEHRFLPELDGPLAEVGSKSGVAGLFAAPTLSLVPGTLEDPTAPGSESTQRHRDATGTSSTEPLPDWWAGSTAPLVYVSFGSVAATIGLFPVLYELVLTALADLPVRVLITLGDGADPEALGPIPANAHVERWWPQQQVMPHAAAMVGHGGFGTTLLGLAAGVPMVVLPLFADQPFNAQRVAAVGAGIALEGGPPAVAMLGDAVERVLDEPGYRAQAASVAEDIAALPVASEAVAYLEDLAR
jgi:hypothetical protein